MFTFVLFLINVLFVILSWRWSVKAFKCGDTALGWTHLFASAFNFAAILVVIFA